MIDLLDIRYVRLGTRDLVAADRFAREVVGLEQARVENGAHYYRSDGRDGTLVLFEGDRRTTRWASNCEMRGELDRAAGELSNAGLPGCRGLGGGVRAATSRRVFIRFRDPTGNPIELVVRPHHSGPRYFASRDAGITGFSHVGLCSTDPARDERFWTQLLGAASAASATPRCCASTRCTTA